jgi:hypothetical protein
MPGKSYFPSFFYLLILSTAILILLSPLKIQAQISDPNTIHLGSFTPSPTPTPTVTPTPTMTPTPTTEQNQPDQPGDNTTLPKPPDSSYVNAASVDGLVADIRGSCIESGVAGRVTVRDFPCVDAIAAPYDSTAIDNLRFSATKFEFLQCVGFTRAASIVGNGIQLDKGGNAIDFLTNVPSGCTLIDKTNPTQALQVGDLPIWSSKHVTDIYGHIAYVTQIFDANTFKVGEGNFCSAGEVCNGIKTVDSPMLLGWLHCTK